MRSVRAKHPATEVVPLSRFGLHDIESLRLALRGSSVVDWVSLHFEHDEEVEAFLRVNEFEPTDPGDRRHLLELKRRAVEYLETHLGYRVPERVAGVDDVRSLFRFASRREGRRSDRFYACLCLKVMHILHHADATELQVNLPLSSAEVHVLVQAKIERTVRGLIERDFRIVHFAGNRKARNSIISKLLAKKDTHSAPIFDKLRFRLVVERREDVPPLLLAMTRELVPFNFFVPSQTHNSLIDLDRMLSRAGNVISLQSEEGLAAPLNEPHVVRLSEARRNEFSGPDYRIVNVVADVPVRVDRLFLPYEHKFRELGPVILSPVEFQIVDQKTARANESGENRHTLYKARQKAQVKRRLEAGTRHKGGDGPRLSQLPRPRSELE